MKAERNTAVTSSLINFLNIVESGEQLINEINFERDRENISKYNIKQFAQNIIDSRRNLPNCEFQSIEDIINLDCVDDTLIEILYSNFESNIIFGKKDLFLLNTIAKSNHNFQIALHACQISKTCLKFPIKSYNDLEPLFKQELHPKIKSSNIDFKLFRKYFSDKFFPITTSEDFFSKLMCSLFWGEYCHTVEKNELNYFKNY
ncbi:hypothetical protein [Pareuzebyella sediminis]|uniref:hypothetical protein n=1 Tax=Pareuzebyella sediminis TaxID=2607998 RepID=UPI0011EFA679|nr:hypothetical protein [Pareuzebyella sediminis]